MKRKLYVAYGSNMSVEQMKFRCPNAVLVGTGILKGWSLVFQYHATIEESAGGTVPVVVWEITKADENKLDRYEGFPSYYLKRDVILTYTDQEGNRHEAQKAMVYVMHPSYRGGKKKPSRDYFEVLSEGYERFGFDKNILQKAYDEAL